MASIEAILQCAHLSEHFNPDFNRHIDTSFLFLLFIYFSFFICVELQAKISEAYIPLL